MNSLKYKEPCIYHLRGRCRFGPKCRYAHLNEKSSRVELLRSGVESQEKCSGVESQEKCSGANGYYAPDSNSPFGLSEENKYATGFADRSRPSTPGRKYEPFGAPLYFGQVARTDQTTHLKAFKDFILEWVKRRIWFLSETGGKNWAARAKKEAIDVLVGWKIEDAVRLEQISTATGTAENFLAWVLYHISRT
jgi:hypothetical protein